MLDRDQFQAAYARALPYADYVATGTPPQQESWEAFRRDHPIGQAQIELVGRFSRRIHALAISSAWCGDCVQQLPFLAQFEAANPERFRPRFLDRDENAGLAEHFMICEGLRVPVVLFLNEDFDFIALFGDRSLTRYRAMAAARLGSLCPLPGAAVAAEEAEATRQDWLNELERVHLLCRLSPKLRARHGD
ncbi:MAG: thioredoxin family protein [Phycisphaeraceae bacterium]|nr:MAG: thioredoxin family protein [Phycisphaeraceae bacterium]